MGLRMDGIHNPSVPSGPTTAHKASDGPDKDTPLVELMAEKDRVEAELTALSSVLDSVRTIYVRLVDTRADLNLIAWSQHEHEFDNF